MALPFFAAKRGGGGQRQGWEAGAGGYWFLGAEARAREKKTKNKSIVCKNRHLKK